MSLLLNILYLIIYLFIQFSKVEFFNFFPISSSSTFTIVLGWLVGWLVGWFYSTSNFFRSFNAELNLKQFSLV